MIDELQVKNLALIKDVSLEFSPHMTVLTGETGAGKTALLTALKLIVGERADSHFVREGSESIELSARIYSSRKPDDEECIATRKVSKDGRSRCSLNGSMASVSQLAEVIGSDIDLCGQHEHQRLRSAHSHAEIFDAWIGTEAQTSKERYQQSCHSYKQVKQELERALAEESSLAEDLEEAARYLKEFEALNLSGEDELEELEREMPRYEFAENLLSYSERAYEALCDEHAALDALALCDDELARALNYDASLVPLYENLTNAKLLIEDLAQELRHYKRGIEFDPYELERLRLRSDEIKAFLKRYGPRMQDVYARYENCAARLARYEEKDDLIQRLDTKLASARAEFEAASVAYYELRKSYADTFCAEVAGLFADLEMPQASLSLQIKLLDLEKRSLTSPLELEFLFRPTVHTKPQPLARIASGGEASRVMLALKCILGAADGVSTLVFDEIDAGVGGQAATAIARVLSRLAQNHQLIVVTHLAQIAACADRHYLVHKDNSDDGMMQTYLRELDSSERVLELARMLSGESSQRACAHAAELLEHARTLKSS